METVIKKDLKKKEQKYMNINTKSTNMELLDEVREYVETRFDQIEKFFSEKKDREIEIQVELGKESNHHMHGEIFFTKVRCESSGEFYYVEAEEDELTKAVDSACEALKRKIDDSTKKGQDLERKEGSRIKKFMRGFWR